MKHIDNETLNQIRQAIDITEVINEYVPLTKKGTNYVASCPFHEDNHPSFSVSPTKQIFKCFSCGRGGNVFTFLQEIEGVNFVEAVKIAAKFANIALNYEFLDQSTNAHPHQDLLDIHQRVAEFYHYYLVNTENGKEAYQYLLERGFSKETMQHFQLGLAPSKVELILQYLKQYNFTSQQLKDSGIFLLDESNGEIYGDRFKHRIIFPLSNSQGQVVAFSGRIFQEDQNDQAKYLNSPETAIFNKSQLIYNFHRAKASIRQKKRVLICEGYMDVMALCQAGIDNVVATMGTSLTRQHIETLAKHSSHIYFIFDGDEAGQKATLRGFELVKQDTRNITAQAVSIPQQADPDEWIKLHGAESFIKLLNHGLHFYDFYKQYQAKHYDLDNQADLSKYIDDLVTFIAQTVSPIERELQLQDIANQYQLPLEILKEQAARKNFQQIHQSSKHSSVQDTFQTDTGLYQRQTFQQSGIQSFSAYQSEKQLIFHLIFYEEAWKYLESLSEPLIFYHDFSQKIYFLLEDYYYDKGNPLPLTGISDDIHDPQMSQLLSEILWDNEKFEYNEKVLVDCIKGIEAAFIDQEINEIRQKIKEANNAQDHQIVQNLSIQIMQLMRQAKNLRR